MWLYVPYEDLGPGARNFHGFGAQGTGSRGLGYAIYMGLEPGFEDLGLGSRNLRGFRPRAREFEAWAT